MLSCERATFLISQAQDRTLGRGERYKLALHVSLCKACRAFKTQVPFLRRAARAFAKADTDPGARDSGE
jgi:hypothetical protein